LQKISKTKHLNIFNTNKVIENKESSETKIQEKNKNAKEKKYFEFL
jgi:hypothetical protein